MAGLLGPAHHRGSGVILLVGGIVALIGRGAGRRIGLIVGQNLGASREPLIWTSGGTMTLRLESPSGVLVGIVGIGVLAFRAFGSEASAPG